MTRKQLFEMLATALHRAMPDPVVKAVTPSERMRWNFTCMCVATELEVHNSTFDRKRFLADCKNGPNKES